MEEYRTEKQTSATCAPQSNNTRRGSHGGGEVDGLYIWDPRTEQVQIYLFFWIFEFFALLDEHQNQFHHIPFFRSDG
jgi:hypothetical protein